MVGIAILQAEINLTNRLIMKTLLAILAGLAICVAIFANLEPKSANEGSSQVAVKSEAKKDDTPVRPDISVIVDAERYIRSQLKDPESAKFRNVDAYFTKDGDTVACGEVNAKNSFGAYEGYKWFIGTGNNVLFDGDTEKKFVDVVKELCHSKSRIASTLK